MRGLPKRLPVAGIAVWAAALIAPFSLSPLWIFVVTHALLIGLAVLGLQVLGGWCRTVSLAQAGLVGVGCGTTFYALGGREFDGGLEWPWHVAVGLSVAVPACLMLAVALASWRLSLPYVLVLTYAVQSGVEFYVLPDSRYTGFMESYRARPSPFGISVDTDRRFYFVVLAVLAIAILGLHRLRGTKYGRAMIAAGADPEAAAVVGVSPRATRAVGLVLSGALAGLAGSLMMLHYGNPPGVLAFVGYQSLVYVGIALIAGRSLLAVPVVAVALEVTAVGQGAYTIPHSNPLITCGVLALVATALGPRGLAGLWRPRRRTPPPRLPARASN